MVKGKKTGGGAAATGKRKATPGELALNEAAQETYRARGLILPGFIPGPPGADGNPTGVVDVGITDPFRSHFLRGLLKHPKVGLKDASKEDKLQYLREHCQHIKSAVSGWASSARTRTKGELKANAALCTALAGEPWPVQQPGQPKPDFDVQLAAFHERAKPFFDGLPFGRAHPDTYYHLELLMRKYHVHDKPDLLLSDHLTLDGETLALRDITLIIRGEEIATVKGSNTEWPRYDETQLQLYMNIRGKVEADRALANCEELERQMKQLRGVAVPAPAAAAAAGPSMGVRASSSGEEEEEEDDGPRRRRRRGREEKPPAAKKKGGKGRAVQEDAPSSSEDDAGSSSSSDDGSGSSSDETALPPRKKKAKGGKGGKGKGKGGKKKKPAGSEDEDEGAEVGSEGEGEGEGEPEPATGTKHSSSSSSGGGGSGKKKGKRPKGSSSRR